MRQLTILVLLLISVDSYSCSCGGLRSISIADILNHEVIFSGKIVSIHEDKDEDNYRVWRALFKVNDINKPKLKIDTLSVYTNYGSAACGLDFRVGDTWLIIGTYYKGKYYASLCSKSINRKGFNFFTYKHRKSYTNRYSKKSKFINSKVDGYQFKGQLIHGQPSGQWLKLKAKDTVEIMNFKNGLRHGFQLEKYEDKLSRSTYEYLDGKRDGSYRQYNSDGKLIYFIQFKDDKYHGKYEHYLDNGNPYLIGQYENDKRVGEWKTYVDGKLKYKSTYNNVGQLIETIEF
jgi:antitoxin component YwqK of YwqJK toxin-antitoxin module